jgi:hypothetical protein
MFRFLAGIPPGLAFLFVRLALVLRKAWHTGKGGLTSIKLSIPRRRRNDLSALHVRFLTTVPLVPRNSLCTACVYAHVVRGYEPCEVLIACGYAFPPREVSLFPVRECTDYKPKRKRSGVEIASEGVVSFPPLDN